MLILVKAIDAAICTAAGWRLKAEHGLTHQNRNARADCHA